MSFPSVLKHIFALILPGTVTILVPWWIHPQWNGYPLFRTLGTLVGLAGLSLFIYTVVLFRTRGHGTLAPWAPTQTLVMEGPYRYCRNPMITGVFFVLVGETLFFLSKGLLIWTVSFFFINTIYFIVSEEPVLEERFGEEYRSYKKKVPRWMPLLDQKS